MGTLAMELCVMISMSVNWVWMTVRLAMGSVKIQLAPIDATVPEDMYLTLKMESVKISMNAQPVSMIAISMLTVTTQSVPSIVAARKALLEMAVVVMRMKRVCVMVPCVILQQLALMLMMYTYVSAMKGLKV